MTWGTDMKLLWLILIPSFAQAFTLNNSIGARFGENSVSVRVGINPTPCDNIDLDEVTGMLSAAINDYWNTVPTSRLKLTDGGSYNTADDDFHTGELCLTGGICGGTPVPGVSDIVVTCNKNSSNFTAGSLLALTLPNVIRGKDIRGAVILLNDLSTTFDQLSYDKKVAVISHEIGHAIGLGHSEERAALMYYAVVPQRNSLGQDDIDGVTYLYPMQFDVFGAGCFLGSTADTPTTGGGSFWPTALLGLVLALVLKSRSKKSRAASFRA